MRIAIVNTKGGVGKTTSAIYLAAALSHQGPTLLLDADHQASATDWAEVASQGGTPLPFEVQPANLAVLRRPTPEHVRHTVIDTPPGDPNTLDAAIAGADVVVLPTEAAAMDMTRLWATVAHLDPNKPRVVLLTKASPHTRAHRDAVEILATTDQVATFTASIPRREEIKNAFGTSPTNLFTYPDVVAELLEAME